MDPAKTNKNTLRALLSAADSGDLEGVMRCFSPAYVDHDPPPVRQSGTSHFEGARRAFEYFLAAFPDTRHSLHDLLAEGDRVAARISAVGTHLGELFGIAPTGQRIENESLVIYRFEDGLIVERWCRERRGVLDQLGGGKPGAGFAAPTEEPIP
jgi:predicted ester cyclase